MTEFVFQGITESSHVDTINQLLTLPNLDSVVISTAFMTAHGLAKIERTLLTVANKTTIFAGIRNGITTAQSILKAIEIGCTVYAVDTGSRNLTFHPKIYFSKSANAGHLIVGSANLTAGGLVNNIEASVSMILDLKLEQDRNIATQVQDKIAAMIQDYPVHVFQVSSHDIVKELLDSGRLIDETMVREPPSTGTSNNRDLDRIPKMKLRTKFLNTIEKTKEKQQVNIEPIKPIKTDGLVPANMTLVWRSKELARRDLDIPIGNNTNRTGSMLLKKGTFSDIDHRHYFRENAFGSLDWSFDTSPNKGHIERASAHFQIIIRGVDYGIHELDISHNTKTDTPSYEQSNSMTGLHWGAARELIAQEDLLERAMAIYKDNDKDDYYILEID